MQRLILSLLFLALSMGGAQAAASPWAETDHTRVRLVSAASAVGDDAAVRLGLQFELEKGWKVYWRSPGDAGYPPRLDWAGSENLAGLAIQWPLPGRFSVLGLETLGYKDAVLYPLRAALSEPGRALSVKTTVDYLACNEICIPYRATLALDLPTGAAEPAPEAHDISRALARVPPDGDARPMGLALTAAETLVRDGKTWLRVTATSDRPFDAPDLFAEGHEDLRFGKPDVRLSPDRKTAVLQTRVDGVKYLASKSFLNQAVTLTVADGERAAEFKRTIKAATGPAAVGEGGIGPSFLTILGLAVLGGLILNLMPCVLPVLSIKLLSVIKHSDSDPRTVRLSFLASAAGILTAFLILAGVLAGLKTGGALVGWGIQFQQPLFLILMTAVVSLFAFNLWGFFEVRLPMAVSDLGEHSAHVHGLGGHFLSGAFATILATPCSAPFLGTAVGFALARGTGEIFAVFAALGIGLALPYLGVAARPSLARLMPKPGPWMATLKKVLGLALAATAVWLLSVLAISLSAVGAAIVAALIAGGGAVLWWAHRKGTSGWLGFALLTALALSLPIILPKPDAAADPAILKGIWQPFDDEAVPKLVADGKVVFVDVTADWCITCQVNKTAVLGRGDVAKRLTGTNVVALKADWTRPNDAIARYLASFGRYGIPFNAVYGPGAPGGIVLPELLRSSVVLDALEKASKP